MTDATTDAATAAPPLPGLISRAIGVVVSPTQTFQAIVRTPKVLGALGLVTFMSILLAAGFMSTQRGKEAFLNMMYERTQQGTPTPAQQAQSQQMLDGLQKMADERPVLLLIFMTGGNLIFVPLVMVVMGGILFAVFNAAMGGTASFKQVMAVVAHSSFMLTLQQLVTTPLNYARTSMTSATSLGVLLPMFEKGTFLGNFLGIIDLFSIWSTIVLAIGLGVLYKRSAKAIAVTLLSLYGAIALGIAYFMSR